MKRNKGDEKMRERFQPQVKLLKQTEALGEFQRRGRTLRPSLVEVAPTAFCNANCGFCFYGQDKSVVGKSGAKIDKDTMSRAIECMGYMGVPAINWTGYGEPSIHPDFRYFTELAKMHGIKQGMFTNAYKTDSYNPEDFDWIRVTVTPKGLEGKVGDNIRELAEQTAVGIGMNITDRTSRFHVRALCQQAKELGVDYFQVRPALAVPGEEQEIIVPPEELKLKETEDFKVFLSPHKFEEYLKERTYDRCFGFHFVPAITPSGMLNACMYRDDYILGDLNAENLTDIWARTKDSFRVTKDCQTCCKNHEINDLLSKLKEPVDDEEFI